AISPAPSARPNTNTTQTGSSRRGQPGHTPRTPRSGSRRPSGIAKSTSVDSVPESGRINRGKYTLLTRYALPTMDMLDLLSVQAKMFQTRRPAYVTRNEEVPLRLTPPQHPEREHQHGRGQQRLDENPADPQDRLPVAQLHIAPRQFEQQVFEPRDLAEIKRNPASRAP